MKIAYITNCAHFYLGGVENYANIFFEYFGSKYEITEFPTLKIKKNETNKKPWPFIKTSDNLLGWKPYLFVWGGSYNQKKIQKIFDDFDVVIISAIFLPKKWLNHQKVILVQHMDKSWYTSKNKPWLMRLGQLINRCLFNVGTNNNPFSKAKNNVFFCQETADFTVGKAWYIPLAHKKKNEIIFQEFNREKFVWISRLDQRQKNVNAIVKLANVNPNIKIYGQGYSQKIIEKKLKNKSQYCGFLPQRLINNTLSKSKALLITSFFEGLPFTAIEALSNGTPVILFDTFDSAKFLAKSGAVFLINKGDLNGFNQKINWINRLNSSEYSKISRRAIEFAKTNFSKESFWNNWNKVFQTIENQKIS